MKAVIYARVSTEEQEKGYSLDAQIKACKDYCKMKGWEVIKIFKEIKTAREMKSRSNLLKAIELIKMGVADMLVAWRLDRIVRSSIDFARLVQEIGYKLTSVMENLDGSTPIGRFAMKIAVDVAELESDIISERTKLGVKERINKGLPHGYPKGRDRIPAWKKEKIIELYKQGRTYKEIQQELKVGAGTIADTLRQVGLIE